MKTQHTNQRIIDVLRLNLEMTYDDAIKYLDEWAEGEQEDYDPSGEEEMREHYAEREMESHMDHIRSQGGDYWKNDAGEWMCG